MAISARLSRTIHRALGDEAGEDLINWMGQVESNRSELRELMEAWAARTDGRFEALGARFDAIDHRFESLSARSDARFDAVVARSDAQFAEQRHWMELRFAEAQVSFATQREQFEARFGSLEVRIERRYAELFKWSIAFWIGGVGAIATLLRLLK